MVIITPTRLFTTPLIPTVTQSPIATPGESSDGLATGAVVGIVVGVLLGVLVSVIAIGISAWLAYYLHTFIYLHVHNFLVLTYM